VKKVSVTEKKTTPGPEDTYDLSGIVLEAIGLHVPDDLVTE
jgi:hypothetical protein